MLSNGKGLLVPRAQNILILNAPKQSKFGMSPGICPVVWQATPLVIVHRDQVLSIFQFCSEQLPLYDFANATLTCKFKNLVPTRETHSEGRLASTRRPRRGPGTTEASAGTRRATAAVLSVSANSDCSSEFYSRTFSNSIPDEQIIATRSDDACERRAQITYANSKTNGKKTSRKNLNFRPLRSRANVNRSRAMYPEDQREKKKKSIRVNSIQFDRIHLISSFETSHLIHLSVSREPLNGFEYWEVSTLLREASRISTSSGQWTSRSGCASAGTGANSANHPLGQATGPLDWCSSSGVLTRRDAFVSAARHRVNDTLTEWMLELAIFDTRTLRFSPFQPPRSIHGCIVDSQKRFNKAHTRSRLCF